MHNKDKDVFQSTHKQLIDKYLTTPKEWLVTHDEIKDIKNVSTKELLWDLVFFSQTHKNKPISKSDTDIRTYIIPFPQREYRQYDPDLESVWESMQGNSEMWNQEWFKKDIDYILNHHIKSLSFDDMIVLQTNLISIYVLEQKLDNAMLLLENLRKYESIFTDSQRKTFLYIVWIVYFYKAHGKDKEFYEKSLACFDELIGPDLDNDKYMEILSKKVYALFKLDKHADCLSAIDEFLPLSEEAEHTDKDIKIARMDALQIQWVIYESQKEYQKAIQSFRTYLNYNPVNSDAVKNHIRILSEKSPE